MVAVKTAPSTTPSPSHRKSALQVAKSVVKSVCPPVLWSAARWATKPGRPTEVMPVAGPQPVPQPVPQPEPPPVQQQSAQPERQPEPQQPKTPEMRRARTVAELEQEILRCHQASPNGYDAFRAVTDTFVFEPEISLPDDPDSPEYRDAQMRIYELVSGRTNYNPVVDEQTPFEMELRVQNPYPYCTGSAVNVGEQLMAIGFLIRTMNLPAGGSVLEFGIGWGKTTIELAQLGYQVTGVDICEPYLELNRRRCAMLNVPVELVHSDMLGFQTDKQFDRILFYECFHHCADPNALIAKLDRMVAPGGAVIFAGEPIYAQSPVPWGIRLDGISVFSIRHYGWLELGFHPDYFNRMLARHGWTAETLPSKDVPYQSVIVARRK